MTWAEWNPVREKKSANVTVLTTSETSSGSNEVQNQKAPRPQDMKKKHWSTIDHLELVASHRSYYEEGDADAFTGTLADASGSSRLYDEHGQLRYIPMPSADPKDPLNLPTWRKYAAVGSLCLFAALAVAPEAIIGALVPVFVLYYAGLDPHLLDHLKFKAGGPVEVNPLAGLARLSPDPLWRIYLIATLPVLIIGIANYVIVPLSIAVGRRPVILTTGMLAIIGGIWAGFTTTLSHHLAARALQALGVGTVESLIPLILQDIVFIHHRNKAIAAVWCSQGFIIVSIGIFSPFIIAATDWRWIYWITACPAFVAWILMIFWVPETRWRRTSAELNGISSLPLRPGQTRPELDYEKHGSLDRKSQFGLFQYGMWWPECWKACIAIAQSMFFPNMIFISLINSGFVATVLAAGLVGAPVLLAHGWPFKLLGFAVLAIAVAAAFVAVLGGWGSDKISNFITRKYYGGRREPEVHLINWIIPMFSTILGCILFGVGGEYVKEVHWMVFILGIFFLSYGLLTINIIQSVYVVECYPEWAGPVLVNVSSFRNIVAFGLSFKMVAWVEQIGYLRMFGIYAAVLAAIAVVGLPLIFVYGKRIRARCGRLVRDKGAVAGF